MCVCVSGGAAAGRGAPQRRWDLSWALILIRERLGMVSWEVIIASPLNIDHETSVYCDVFIPKSIFTT